jgi:hypothetical protein
MHLLTGGGSGTAVFGGTTTDGRDLVMKHGGSKDTKEVIALVQVSDELYKRRSISQDAALFLQRRIPEFVGVYLSQFHLRDRGAEFWTKLRATRQQPMVIQRTPSMPGGKCPMGTLRSMLMQEQPQDLAATYKQDDHDQRKPHSMSLLCDKKKLRRVAIEPCEKLRFRVCADSVDIGIPGLHRDGTIENGVDLLLRLRDVLFAQQTEHQWKVTLIQKKIGGDNARNGANVLTSGELTGAVLQTCIEEFTTVILSLREVTLPNEASNLDAVREELQNLMLTRNVDSVSKKLDSFVGGAITKNFGRNGRFRSMRDLGIQLRSMDHSLQLTAEEEVPARLLSKILEPGSGWNDVFADLPFSVLKLDQIQYTTWLDLLELATSFDEPSVTECIWTCGLTDAGLHNCFLSAERLELFDLGEAKHIPQPAFLTKFLMSFFHAFGMEDDGCEAWINRFRLVDDERLELTEDMPAKIEYMFKAYGDATDFFITQLFDGDERVRILLANYVVLQLFSDAGFCLGRWKEKGGGTERYGERSAMYLSKWLWRALWDMYIGARCYRRLVPEGPKTSVYEVRERLGDT